MTFHQKKRFVAGMIVLLLVCIGGVFALKQVGKREGSAPKEEIAETPTAEPGHFLEKEEEVIVFGDGETKKKKKKVKIQKDAVVWVTDCSSKGFEQLSSDMNRLLKKKGYDFKVQFLSQSDIGMKIGEEESSKAVKKIQKDYPYIDILQWSSSKYQSGEYYLPLDNYLAGEGKKLKEAYPDALWQIGRCNGKLRLVPQAETYKQVYFAFNRKYFTEKDLEGFEPTLQGLEKFLKDKDVRQVRYPVVLSNSLVYFSYGSLLDGYYEAGMFVPENGGDVSLWYEAPQVKKFYQRLNKWYRLGLLSERNNFTEDEVETELNGGRGLESELYSNKVMVYIGYGEEPKEMGAEGKSIIRWAVHRNGGMYPGMSSGVSRKAPHKKQALSLLQAVHTDQELADCMLYGRKTKDYKMNKGAVVRNYNAKFDPESRQSSFGQLPIAHPLYVNRKHPAAEKIKNYFDAVTVENSKNLGFVPDNAGFKDIQNKLEGFLYKNENIWRNDQFGKKYQELLDQLEEEDYQNYADSVNAQYREWKKKY